MKTLGLLGGMSCESTAVYYRHLNDLVSQRLGGLHSCDLLLKSFDFAQIEECQAAGDWARAADILTRGARALQDAGALGVVLCTNTMHKVAAQIEGGIDIPLIHIADATATEIGRRGLGRPLLLATRYTMEQDFYKGRLSDRHGIEVVTPGEEDRTAIHDIIYRELCQGIIDPASKRSYLDIIDRARDRSIDSVIFGCTEIGLLVGQGDLDLPILDTTLIHSQAAVDFALGESASQPQSFRRQAEPVQ